MKYKLIGMYVVLFVIIFLIDNFVVMNRIYSDGKKAYRLGDVIGESGACCRRYSGEFPTGYHLHKYKYSIAADYMRKVDKKEQYDILNNIVKKRTKIRHKLYDHYINMHLRTGDVMTKDNPEVDKKNINSYLKKHIKNKNGVNRVKPLSYYDKVIKYLKKNNINNKNILIITGWHYIDTIKKENSLKYIEEIKKFFEKNGYNVTTRLNEDPDEDFIIMSNSKYFVQSGGGYSRLIGKMIELNGNTVINDDTIK